MLGKISSLPHAIREQVNLRLADHQAGDALAQWLNSLPEVQAVLKEKFAAEPINKDNVSEYRTHSFRRWQIRRAALEFNAQSANPDSQSSANPHRLDHLLDWVFERLAALAQSSPLPDDPDTELRQLRHFIADIVALRRGDLITRRIGFEEQRLEFHRAKKQQELEQLFWQWTKRPDIQATLYPHRDPDKMRLDVVRLLDRELLGRKPTDGAPDPDPACSI
ncbi:MAG TPA: hypothetical protein VJA21_23000 [Verrucomicrobiae bacterium]